MKVNLCPSIHERLDGSGMTVLRGVIEGGPTILQQYHLFIEKILDK